MSVKQSAAKELAVLSAKQTYSSEEDEAVRSATLQNSCQSLCKLYVGEIDA